MHIDYIVAGLGNPGGKYEFTRHNAGFIAADELCRRLGGKCRKIKCKALYEIFDFSGKNVLVMKPQTFMNLSGEAVRDMAECFKVPPERIIAVFDDTALPAGRIRIKKNGSDGGHNGVKSIIYQLSSDAFPRVKIGIGDRGEADLADYVLNELDEEAMKCAKNAAPEAVLTIIGSGIDEAMQIFNKKG